MENEENDKSQQNSESASSGLLSATQIVHWPTGPVYTCDKHASELIGLGNFLGSHIISTKAEDGHECSNCLNESR